jgi:hypothetical protein
MWMITLVSGGVVIVLSEPLIVTRLRLFLIQFRNKIEPQAASAV